MMICNKKIFYILKYNKIYVEGKKELKWWYKFFMWCSVSKEIWFLCYFFGDFCYVVGLKIGI